MHLHTYTTDECKIVHRDIAARNVLLAGKKNLAKKNGQEQTVLQIVKSGDQGFFGAVLFSLASNGALSGRGRRAPAQLDACFSKICSFGLHTGICFALA